MSRRRGGFSLMEVAVASGIFLLCAGFALQTLFHNRRAKDTTARVGNLQEVRRVLLALNQSLQHAVAIESPGWDSVAAQLAFVDDEYRKVRFYPAGQDGTPIDLASMGVLPLDASLRLMKRIETVGQDPEVVRIDRGLRIRQVRFFRLGRGLIGFRMEIGGDPNASTVALQRPETFSTVIALNRQVH